ncbi:MAG: DUF262 domain-containing protein [Blastocatellia bacterium]|nr:DUF262 domain-containing protein [Blastocatellia bacterium]
MAQEVSELLEQEDEEEVLDEASQDDTVVPERYDISSYGADYDVDGLVRRLDRGDIFIPSFQRDYVWKIQEASRFIESLLLGLPVPGVFLAKEPESNKLLVIDGQQRLKTLQFFYKGIFDPRPEDKTHRVFALTKVQSNFEELTYDALDERDRLKLDNSIIHATVVKQDSPKDDDTSIYHIFERLNSTGRKLYPQEIRTAVYHGPFIDLIKQLNDYPAWRQIYGKKNKRLKDQELILRFLALYFDFEHYEKPMTEFLNKFTKKHRFAGKRFLPEATKVFTDTINVALDLEINTIFRPERAINAAVFDSVMVGLAKRISRGPIENPERIVETYLGLLKDREYAAAVFQATSDVEKVLTRISKAIEAFADL